MTVASAAEVSLAQAHARIVELEGEVAALRGDTAPAELLRPLGFSPRQARMLLLLSNRAPKIVPREAITGSEMSRKGIDVLIHKTRRVIKAKGYPGQLETIQGHGYRVDRELAEWVRQQTHPEPISHEG